MVRIIRENTRFSLTGGKLLAVAAISAVSGLVGNSNQAQAALSASGPITTLQPVQGLIPGSGNGGIRNNDVTAGDTFSIAVVGFNATTTSAQGAYLTTPSTFDPVFGTTNTYVGAALGSQTLTISSSEVIGLTTTVDTITLSVPTNFAPSGTKIGTRYIDDLELDISEYNATVPGNTAAYDTIDFTSPVVATGSGSIIYGTGNTVFTLNPAVTASNGGASYAGVEGVNAGTGATYASSIESYGMHTFTFSLTYPNVVVPEPTSLSLLGLGGAALLSRRRRSVA